MNLMIKDKELIQHTIFIILFFLYLWDTLQNSIQPRSCRTHLYEK